MTAFLLWLVAQMMATTNDPADDDKTLACYCAMRDMTEEGWI